MDKAKRVLLVQQTPFAQGLRMAGIQEIVEIIFIKDSQFGHGILTLFLGWLVREATPQLVRAAMQTPDTGCRSLRSKSIKTAGSHWANQR